MKLPASWLALALSVCAGAQAAESAKQVNLYIWNEYLAPDTLSSFEQQTGIKVVVDHFDSLETVETKLLTGRTGYDLVLTAGQHLQRAIRSGAIQPLDKGALPNFAGLGDEFVQHMAAFDPGNRYAGLYAWGTTGFGYQEEAIRTRMADAPVDSWAMLMDPAVVARFADCGVSLLDDPNEVFGAAMRYLGLDINRLQTRTNGPTGAIDTGAGVFQVADGGVDGVILSLLGRRVFVGRHHQGRTQLANGIQRTLALVVVALDHKLVARRPRAGKIELDPHDRDCVAGHASIGNRFAARRYRLGVDFVLDVAGEFNHRAIAREAVAISFSIVNC